MNPQFTLIVNPRAARGRGNRAGDFVADALARRGISFERLVTRAQGDATDLACRATADTVVAVGGDGTINEVVNGIAGSGKGLGIIPAGSGNDFIKALGIPAKVPEALEILVRGNRRRIDLGRTYIRRTQNESMRFFCNGVGIGFDAAVAARTAEVTRFSGFGVYVVAVLKTLGTYIAPTYDIVVDANRSSGRKLLVAIGNGPCAGGGFFLTPDAKADDGLLDVCSVRAMGTGGILRLMPVVMKGKHLKLPAVEAFRGRTIAVTADREFAVHADGEVLGRDIREIRIELEAGAIEVIAEPGVHT